MSNKTKIKLWFDFDWRYWGLGLFIYSQAQYSYISTQLGPISIYIGGR
jgi:hypothetical protein